MYYAKWATNKEIKDYLKKTDINKEVKKSGLPLMYEGQNLYIDEKENHSLIIGSTGSGKTQVAILPLIKLSMMSGESFVVNDVKGEIYKQNAKELKKLGYNVIALDFENPEFGNSWNPFILPYELYQNNKKDKAFNLIEDLGYYLFSNPQEKQMDDFWINSTIDYFTGLTLYLFEKGSKEEINLNSVYTLANELNDKKAIDSFLNSLDKTSTIYFNVSGTLTSPIETRGGILATFNQKIKKYIARETLSNMLLSSDFDIKEIDTKKTAIFIISGLSSYSNSLIPLFVSQTIETIDIFGIKEKNVNIILDEFDTLLPIRNFTKIINYTRSIKVRLTVVIKSYIDLLNTYGKEQSEIIKLCFSNIVYLLSNDIYTLEEISKLCGNQEINKKVKPLISTEELKVMKPFEAIVLIPRIMPFKTKLLPDYKINWHFTKEEQQLPKRTPNELKIYKL